MRSTRFTRSLLTHAALSGAIALGALAARSKPALACGGFFCSAAQSVNQAAERILFVDGGDGTITAVIEISYEGPAENFSWLLPLASVPEPGDLEVASDAVFDRLQLATNPQYSLVTRVEGRCDTPADSNNPAASVSDGGALDPRGSGYGGVSVAGSGVVGHFDWVALSFDPTLPSPSDAAVSWLTENGYDVPPGASDLLGPYLGEAGMHLLALKLVKGAPEGAIRPLVVRYPAELPMIPIKLTSVAANDDMGVLVWIAAPERAVPFNYLALELNEARIDWFNPAQSYGAVVTAAADDAGGHGFVTEYAGHPAQELGQLVWGEQDEDTWRGFRDGDFGGPSRLFTSLAGIYGGSDSFWEVVRETVTLPPNVPLEELRLCPVCHADGIEYSRAALTEALEAEMIAPLRRVQELIDRQPYLTRLYSTLSASEMTIDPVFTTNPDLPTLSNIHVAQRVIECEQGLYQSQAGWRIHLPQGGVVRGVGTAQRWPAAFSSQPANLRVLQMSASGDGAVVDDLSSDIEAGLAAYNATVPRPNGSGCFCNVGARGSDAPAAGLSALIVLGFSIRRRSGRGSATARYG